MVTTAFALGPFRVDPRTRVLTRDGEIEKIPLKTIEVLLALLDHAGEIVTKDELLERVWPGSIVEEANLTVHVSLLRKTLGGAAPIETIAKRGYRIATPAPAASRNASPAPDSVLRGRYFWNKLTRTALERASTEFSRAIADDPSGGGGHSGLADTLLMQGLFGFDVSRDVFARARKHGEAAARLSPQSAEAHASCAFASLFDAWDFDGPLAALKRARECGPHHAEAFLWSALLHAVRGEFLEALSYVKKAQAIDPLSLKAGVGASFHLYLSQQQEPDKEPLLRVLDLEPEYAAAHWALGLACDELKDFERAHVAHRAAVLYSGGSKTMESNLARSLALAGRKKDATQLKNDLLIAGLSSYRLATIDLALGEKASAIAHLQTAFECRDPWLVLLPIDPMLASLRNDRQVKRIVGAVRGG